MVREARKWLWTPYLVPDAKYGVGNFYPTEAAKPL